MKAYCLKCKEETELVVKDIETGDNRHKTARYKGRCKVCGERICRIIML